MPYYDTMEEDVVRAKEILAKGKANPIEFPNLIAKGVTGGTIYGADTYAAYKLLESFVAEIERLQGQVKEKDQVILNQVRNIGDLRRQLDDKR